MAKIYIYDSTDLDKSQISAVLAPTDHDWIYIYDKLSIDNVHQDAEAIAVFVTSEVTRQHIESMPNLRLIACRSTGFNNVDLEAAADHDVVVVNVPTYGESTVAEYTFTLLLAMTRKLPDTLDKEAEDAHDVTGHDINGKTLGIIGVGHIGKHTIKIAKGFEMEVLAYDPYPDENLAGEFGFKYVDLDELLIHSDAVTIHAPYNGSTHHLLGEREFELMQDHALLINTARGEIVDTGALIEALNSRQIAGAALDVIEGEALLHHNEEMALLRNREISNELLLHGMEISTLKKMSNVIITPHNAYNTVEAVGRINQITGENLIDFWYGKTPNVVKPQKKPTGKLLVVRHGESEWNATGQWTGITDIHLDEKGFREASKLGLALKELPFKVDIAYCSQQIRSRETLEGMLNAAQQFDVDIVTDGAINERDYGEYTGKVKWDIKEEVGEEKFNEIRRGWDVHIPGGESLKAVYERVLPFYQHTIIPRLLRGENVLLVAHGNSIRALMKHIESISDEDVSNLEMLFGQIIVYDIHDNGLLKESKLIEIETTRNPNA